MNAPLHSNSSVRHDPLDWARLVGDASELKEEIRLQLRSRTLRRRRFAAVVSFLAVGAFLSWWIPVLRSTESISTRAANRQTLALADGSVAELNARTELSTDFRYGRRKARLERGEAFFSIRSAPDRPFLLETPHGTVCVTGTQFNVRLDPAGRPSVTLFEGAVRLEHDGHPPVALAPGQQLAYGGAGLTVRTLPEGEAARITAWRRGRLALDGLTLAQAAQRFAEYHGCRIDVTAEVGSLELGGTAPLDSLPEFFAALEDTLAVNVVARGGDFFHIQAR